MLSNEIDSYSQEAMEASTLRIVFLHYWLNQNRIFHFLCCLHFDLINGISLIICSNVQLILQLNQQNTLFIKNIQLLPKCKRHSVQQKNRNVLENNQPRFALNNVQLLIIIEKFIYNHNKINKSSFFFLSLISQFSNIQMNRDLVETHNSPMNRSISKQLYSFPKAIRFESTKQPFCLSSFYDTKRTAFNNRTTSFGYGNKMQIVNKTPAPPVGKYDLNGQFIYNRQKNKGYSFSKDNKSNTLVNPEKSALIPGPGAYNHARLKSIDKYTTLSYSIGAKLQDPMARHQNSLGPGQYELAPSLNANGSYFLSKYMGSGCSKLGRSQRKPINEPNIAPGPGRYLNSQKTSINNTGIYFYSKYRTVQSSKFGRSNRPSIADTKPVPGPGAYGDFTQFAKLNKSWVRASTAGK